MGTKIGMYVPTHLPYWQTERRPRLLVELVMMEHNGLPRLIASARPPDEFMISRSRFQDPTDSLCLTGVQRLGKLLVRVLAGPTLCLPSLADMCLVSHASFLFPCGQLITLRS